MIPSVPATLFMWIFDGLRFKWFMTCRKSRSLKSLEKDGIDMSFLESLQKYCGDTGMYSAHPYEKSGLKNSDLNFYIVKIKH